MAMRRYMAIHTFHSEKTKDAMWASADENNATQKEWAKAWTFNKCKCLATWSGDDDFFSVTGWQKRKRIFTTL